ncbi:MULTISPECIES: YbeD family protein [unclassified Schlesneria]|uniref:YbeD family protein n=1 Tax=unclassified Schlesneria TaxID=2762017 RepID=UPI002EDDB7CA
MNPHPPQELLEQTHSFPGRFVFKAIGRPADDFASRVVAVVRLTLELDFDPPYELKETAAGRHVSVTVEPQVETSQQVIDIYSAIRNLEGLVMLL